MILNGVLLPVVFLWSASHRAYQIYKTYEVMHCHIENIISAPNNSFISGMYKCISVSKCPDGSTHKLTELDTLRCINNTKRPVEVFKELDGVTNYSLVWHGSGATVGVFSGFFGILALASIGVSSVFRNPLFFKVFAGVSGGYAFLLLVLSLVLAEVNGGPI